MSFIATIFLLAQLLFVTTADASVYGTKTSEVKTEISPQVYHIKQKFVGKSTQQSINILDVDLNSTYTTVGIGLPTPYNSLKTTSTIASTYNKEGQRVVGAVNASFFLSNGAPANLIAVENEIINYGILGQNSESPTQQPIAFGIGKDGKAIIDYYRTSMTFTMNGQTFPIDFINNGNVSGSTVLHTTEKTKTSGWPGLELVFTESEIKSDDLHFGQKFTAKLTSKTVGNTPIPEDGFVISIPDAAMQKQISAIPNGTVAEISIQIDSKWQDAEFILAAGPLLVKDGKRNISMPTNSSFASGANPRTAVAVDATGKRLMLVTIDGRQRGHSNGTSLTNLANYLISMGANAAINLDGGGSTTMLARNPGGYSPNLVNKPSDGSERRVSAILQVLNTAPVGNPMAIIVKSIGEQTPGSKVTMQISTAYDEYFNPIYITPEMVNWRVEGDVGTMGGATFTATNSGTGRIIGSYKGIEVSIPVTVSDLTSEPYILDSFDSLSNWKGSSARSTANLSLARAGEPIREGKASFKLTYDFTVGESGTKAAYAITNTSVPILSTPDHIGVWVYGDGNPNWLRGMIVDGTGAKHTIDFTADGGMNFTGWKYVKAKIPSNVSGPFKFERIYIAQTNMNKLTKGTVYFDQLQAVYVEGYEPSMYTDVSDSYWAAGSIAKLNETGLIKGYVDGTFKPAQTITRAEAAVIIARALNLNTTNITEYADVATSHYAHSAIQAVSDAGIIMGREEGKFSPNGQLTRAETATILKRAYKLTGETTLTFTDLTTSHWAYKEIQTLVANNLVSGYEDNTFRPNNTITRAEFATFLSRTME